MGRRVPDGEASGGAGRGHVGRPRRDGCGCCGHDDVYGTQVSGEEGDSGRGDGDSGLYRSDDARYGVAGGSEEVGGGGRVVGVEGVEEGVV